MCVEPLFNGLKMDIHHTHACRGLIFFLVNNLKILVDLATNERQRTI